MGVRKSNYVIFLFCFFLFVLLLFLLRYTTNFLRPMSPNEVNSMIRKADQHNRSIP